MTIAIVKNGATISTTEYSLPANANYSSGSPQTTLQYSQMDIDTSAMAAGDRYQFTIYEKINGGSQKVIWQSVLTGAQNQALITPEWILGEGWDITGLKLAGTDRAFAWSDKLATPVVAFVTGSATVSTTEYSLPANASYSSGSPQAALNYVEAWIDTSNIANGDSFRFRVREQINGTSCVLDEAIVSPIGTGTGPLVFKIRAVGEGWDITAIKLAGTDRAIAWSIRTDTRPVGGGGGGAPPVASATFPVSQDFTVARAGAVSIPVVDSVDAVAFVTIAVQFAGSPTAETIYVGSGTSAGFMPGYAQFSSVTGTGAVGVGFTFNILRDANWPRGVNAAFYVRACDALGSVLL